VAAVAWSDRRRWAAAAAGGLTGLAMAIGFEGLPYIVLAGAAMALRFIFAPDPDRALARYGAWGLGSVAAAFLVSEHKDGISLVLGVKSLLEEI